MLRLNFSLALLMIANLLITLPSVGAQSSVPSQAAQQAPELEILVPAYFYPGATDTYWSAMATAARRVPLTAILNPGSGPGKSADANYVKAVDMLRRAGGRIIGYVHTSYTNALFNK